MFLDFRYKRKDDTKRIKGWYFCYGTPFSASDFSSYCQKIDFCLLSIIIFIKNQIENIFKYKNGMSVTSESERNFVLRFKKKKKSIFHRNKWHCSFLNIKLLYMSYCHFYSDSMKIDRSYFPYNRSVIPCRWKCRILYYWCYIKQFKSYRTDRCKLWLENNPHTNIKGSWRNI